MTVTLHIDLLNTSLEDFAEHFERDFWRFIRYTVSAQAFTWAFFDHVKEAASFRTLTPNQALVRVIRRNEGNTYRSWMVSKAEIGQPLEPLFVLMVTRFQQDRLRIILDDLSEDESFEEIHKERDGERIVHKKHKKRLLEWIEPRWGYEEQDLLKAHEVTPVVKRGRKQTPTEEKREIVEYYLLHQGAVSQEKVGRLFGVSARTVQRYVKAYTEGRLS